MWLAFGLACLEELAKEPGDVESFTSALSLMQACEETRRTVEYVTRLVEASRAPEPKPIIERSSICFRGSR